MERNLKVLLGAARRAIHAYRSSDATRQKFKERPSLAPVTNISAWNALRFFHGALHHFINRACSKQKSLALKIPPIPRTMR